MKTLFYTLFFLSALSFAASAQPKFNIIEKKKSLMPPPLKHQNFKSTNNNNFRIKVSPYWEEVDAPHSYSGYASSYFPQIKVTSVGNVWGKLTFDSMYYDSKMFIHTSDGGKTWLYDSIPSPVGYGMGSFAAIDNNTCYASMYDANDWLGGGIYKTADGGYSWKEIGKGQLSFDNSAVDFVYFFDKMNGIVVADNDGVNTSYMLIYTTHDAGKTWHKVAKNNMQPAMSSIYSSNFDVYATFGNTIWFKAYDDQGNNYILRSDDKGQHWQTYLFNITGKTFHGFAFADKQNGLMVGYEWGGTSDTYVAETHDGGKTWAEINYTGTPMGLFVTVLPGTHTYISTTPAYVPVWGSSYSKDGGKTWNIIDSGYGKEHSAIDFLNPFYGWTGRGEVWDGSITDGGAFKWKLKFSLDNKIIASTGNAVDATVLKIDITNSNNLKLFPNPAKNNVTIQGLNPSVKTKLSLYNISGALMQQSITCGNSHQFGIQRLSTGTYYIKVEAGTSTSILKFTKE
ncbi:MAG: T9SS type A sorting domain-containing protein [Bacteroidetes bacterium]|nr:T9SS type A sorting domain-containing protein [Bacteroidota bacterium]